ncbi:MAG: alanine--tRNA ligase [Nitrososphaerota archaeon]|nr:alanine--tRNA ligase [Nitrososphaerota archaeon]
MSREKELLRKRFSSEPDRYYRVELFKNQGFIRKLCPTCGGYFWTLDESRTHCPEQPCQNYEFLGNPPTAQKLDYTSAWKKIENFFEKKGHRSVARYPVVCRWRPDLFFTIASIVDFQRIESGKVVFEFPANPLIVPQMCLRFLDIGNVGVTGRHYTSFCMVGQHALANEKGYWKDRCIELDFSLLTEEFGIAKEEIVFKEDVWLGPGAFGNSLEYYVRGLELGNAVFTAYEGTPEDYKEYREKVIDMGAGLERFVWITQGTSNSYDAVFKDVLGKLHEKTGMKLEIDRSMEEYFKLAGTLDVDEFKGAIGNYADLARRLNLPEAELRRKIRSMQAIYSIVDHTRTLLFAIADGMLPSNVGGGYNLRVILRRSVDFLNELKLDLELSDLTRWHAESMREMFPELLEHDEDVRTILEVEQTKYSDTRTRAKKILEGLTKKGKKLSEEQSVQLYDSEGITPDLVKAAGIEAEVPVDFYNRITARHVSQKPEETKETLSAGDVAQTVMIFYQERDRFTFEAKVLRIIDRKYVVLDQTAFYARSGGQEPDHGTISGAKVIDVIKYNNVIFHRLEDNVEIGFGEGDRVDCVVDSRRRSLIMRHHTATHIVNGAARRVLGPWVWQHSAFKDEDMGRLDITHFAHLTRDQVLEIERISNEVVRRNLPVRIITMPRDMAEQKYGFRLYQGGVVPIRDLRIVNVECWDVEACGGTHCSSTGDVGLIKITKSERIQDGVERLEFVAGEAAVDFVENQESIIIESSAKLETPQEKLSASISNVKKDAEYARRTAKLLARKLADLMVREIQRISEEIGYGTRLYVSAMEEGLDSEYHLTVGDKLSKEDPSLIYVAIFEEQQRYRILVFSGETAQSKGAKAGILVREIARAMGGSGGGESRFAQGGLVSRPEKIPDIKEIVLNLVMQAK